MTLHQCEEHCEACKGDVRLVHISKIHERSHLNDYGLWWMCDRAVASWRRAGCDVEYETLEHPEEDDMATKKKMTFRELYEAYKVAVVLRRLQDEHSDEIDFVIRTADTNGKRNINPVAHVYAEIRDLFFKRWNLAKMRPFMYQGRVVYWSGARQEVVEEDLIGVDQMVIIEPPTESACAAPCEPAANCCVASVSHVDSVGSRVKWVTPQA